NVENEDEDDIFAEARISKPKISSETEPRQPTASVIGDKPAAVRQAEVNLNPPLFNPTLSDSDDDDLFEKVQHKPKDVNTSSKKAVEDKPNPVVENSKLNNVATAKKKLVSIFSSDSDEE